MWSDFRYRFRRLFRQKSVEAELDDELRFHLERQAEKYVGIGMTREEVMRQARIAFGGSSQIQEECREAHGAYWIESLMQDLRYGVRTLRKSPGFTLVAVLTLALGIGANTAIFSVVQGVILAPLPYDQPDRLVLIWLNNLTLKHYIADSYPDFLDWQRDARSFQQMAAFTSLDYDLSGPGTPEHLTGRQISAGFFSTLGAKLALGREFSPEEDVHGGAPRVIISDRLWKDRFAASPDALGKILTLGGVDYTIVGVLPPDFRLIGGEADVYTPLGQGDPLIYTDRTIHPLTCIARLKPGVTLAQAQTEMEAVQNRLDQLYSAADRGLGIWIEPLKQDLVGDVRGTLLMLLGAVGIVLMIACANVANLMLARSAARTREFAVRSALGARRSRIVRQLITESVLLSLAGGIVGLAFAEVGLKAILAAIPGTLPRSDDIGLNATVLLFTLIISIAIGILFGLAPALRSSDTDPQAGLRHAGRGTTHAHHRAQNILIIVQTALTLVLLVGAGLLFRTIRNLWTINPGFETQHIITFKVGLSPLATKTPEKMRIACQELAERFRQIPGVQAADLTVLVPLAQQSNVGPFWVGSQKPESMAEAPRALYYWTGSDYLRTMQIPLLRGRFFTPQDTLATHPVIVIDSVLAHRYFADKDPVGQTLMVPHWGTVQVIGVVGHVRHWGLDVRDSYTENQIYAPFNQLRDEWLPNFYPNITFAIRTPLDLATVMPEIKAAVYGGGSDQTVYAVQTMQQLVSDSMTSQRFPMILLGIFAMLALVLASIGIYGVVSYSISQRVQEIGVRMALGAGKGDILRMVITQGVRLALIGIVIGGMAALVITRFLSNFSRLLSGVGAGDPATFVTVAAALSCVALLACYIPARRAIRIDPMAALRND